MRTFARWAILSISILVTFAAGHEAHRREWLPLALRQGILELGEPDAAATPHGWSRTPEGAGGPVSVGAGSGGADTMAVIETISTLGYLGGYRKADDSRGVTIHDRAATWAGVNLYVSGHAPEAVLIDLEGRVLHRWTHDFRLQWPDTAPLPFFGREGQTYFRRAHLFENGDLLAVYDGFGLVKLDRDSNVLWARAGGYHHDLHVMADGTIHVLDRDIHLVTRWNERYPVVEDFVTTLDSEGRVRNRVSIVASYERSSYAAVLDEIPRRGDLFHTNTLQILEGTSSPFSAGRALVSVRQLNAVAVVDLDAREVVWNVAGLWRRQHQPELIDSHRLLVFDNQGAGGKARVVEIDVRTQEILWSYPGSDQEPLESHVLGSCQRLPNGNTLITESTRGRAIEVTRDGDVVWEFCSPHRAGADGELVANLFELLRLGPDLPTSWAAS